MEGVRKRREDMKVKKVLMRGSTTPAGASIKLHHDNPGIVPGSLG